MRNNKNPDPSVIYPVEGFDTVTYVKPTIKVVGNDVWIGQNVTILAGVTIGDGAIIGTNSTVGSNVEPYSIVVGNPAKMIRKRFDDELIKLMLHFKWWDKEIEEINTLIPLLTDSNLDNVKQVLRGKIQL